MPMLVPLMPFYVAQPQWGTHWSEGEQQRSEQDTEALTEVGSAVGSSVETEAVAQSEQSTSWDGVTHASLTYVYDEPATWVEFEEGLWLRGSHLPLFEQCYIETDDGHYRNFGSTTDFWRIAECLQSGIVVVAASDMVVHILRKGKEAEKMALKPGLRYLRCFPQSIGVLMIGNDSQRCFAYLEGAYRRDDRKVGRPAVQTELIMAFLRGRDRCHVVFW